MHHRAITRELQRAGLLALAWTACAGEAAVERAPTRDILVAGVQLELPETAQVEAHGRRLRVELAPGQRTPRTLEIASVDAAPRDVLDLRLDLRHGVLRARIERSAGGTGGPEATMIGRVAVGEREVAVRCHSQDEERPSLRWCLELLQTLRTAPVP